MWMMHYADNPQDHLREQILGPATKAETEAWREKLKASRAPEISFRAYQGERYGRPEYQWVGSSFVQPQAMVEDRYLYDPETRQYTVDRYLDDVEKRYGGIDSILIWMMYPNIGIDDRNQFDMVRAMPGGLAGVRKMVADFHRRGVKVLFPIKPWDNGTRDEGEPMWTAWAKMLKEVDGDGLNGDTYYGVPKAYAEAADALGHPVVLEPENGLSWDEPGLSWNLMSWAYWQFPFVPSVSRHKWVEPRHMVHLCSRWSRNKTNELQAAFFNGVGIESWENVWGIWNGITDRDAETIRRTMRLFRFFAPLLSSPEWEPHSSTVQHGVFSSRWPSPDGNHELWALVNRNEYVVEGRQLVVPHRPGTRYFDLWRGVEFPVLPEDGCVTLDFAFEAKGFGCVIAVRGELPGLATLVEEIRRDAGRPLTDYSPEWKPLAQTLVPVAASPAYREPPDGMVLIPKARFEYRVSGIMVEGDNDVGTGVQFPWEDSPRRHHHRVLDLPAFYLDRHPVTNAQFQAFLRGSGYQPTDPENFLKDWRHGTYPEGWENRAVTWVSLEDARAYAAWAGKRLPHDWEWQYAAQGSDGRLYPWGNRWDDSMVPEPNPGRTCLPPPVVGQHPQGASPFGIEDLSATVWQWTEEFVDAHTRAALVRGGSAYRARGSNWYFPQAHRLDQHGKYLLMCPGKDRAATLGFRCAAEFQGVNQGVTP